MITVKRSEKVLFDDDFAIFSYFLYRGICCGYSFEYNQQVDAIQMSTHNICLYFIKAYVVGTHLNCINKLMQFK